MMTASKLTHFVIPAQTGINTVARCQQEHLDSRLRGNDAFAASLCGRYL